MAFDDSPAAFARCIILLGADAASAARLTDSYAAFHSAARGGVWTPSASVVVEEVFAADGSSAECISLAGSVSTFGAGADTVFFINGQTVNTNYTTSATQNYMSAGPITVNSSITVTITSGSRWAIV